MRKIFTTLKSVVAVALIAAMTLAASCSYDDSAIKERVSNVEKDLAALTERVAALEKKLQSEVDALKALIDGQVVVVDVVTDAEGNQTIKLSDGKEITVLAPVACDHECTPCDCDPLQYRVIDGVLEVSADGENWVAVNGVAAECVVANIVLNEDGTATITLANGEEFTVVKAELIECEAARSGLYVLPGETKEVALAVNDAVVDINIMNQPFGWSASVEEAAAEENGDDDLGMGVLAAGGKNYVVKVNGPAATLKEAAKSGVVSIHFNTAAGACKVLSINVNLAELTLSVDAAGNVTVTNSIVATTSHPMMGTMTDFADFHIGIVDAEDYATYGDHIFAETFYEEDWEYKYRANVASTMRSSGFFNVIDEPMWYEDGVCEKESYTLTVDQLAKAFYPAYEFELGKEYIIFVTTESEMVNYIEHPILTNATKANYKRVAVQANLLEETITWNDATCEFNFAGFNYYVVGWTPVADLEDLVLNGVAENLDSALVAMISANSVMSAGAIVGDMTATLKLSELAAVSLTQWAPMLNADTEYVFFVYPFNAATEMELYMHTFVPENLYNFGTFRTKALVQGEFDAAAQFELVSHEEKNIKVNATFGEDVVSVAYNWYETSFDDPEEAAYAILNDIYYTEFVTFAEGERAIAASKYEYYGLPDPVYLGVLAINANGEYVYVEQSFSRTGEEPEDPEQPEQPVAANYNFAEAYGDIAYSDYYVKLYAEDGSHSVVLNFYGISEYNTFFIPVGTYDFGGWAGAVYTGGYSYILYSDATRSNFNGGTVAVAEVDGKYRIEITAQVGDANTAFSAVYEGLIDGLILPSAYVAPEPEPEPEPVGFAPVRAEYDNKMELFEYNGGDAEYAFWLYDEANNYIEVVCKFGPHTSWDYQYSAALVKDGVRTEATSITTQAPSDYNCEAGEKYFVIVATLSDNTSIEVKTQLPAVEVNYFGEGSTYAPGSENQGGNEPSEPEVLPEFVIPGEGTYDLDLRYTKLQSPLSGNEVMFKDDNDHTFFVRFNPGLASIVPGDYAAVGADSYSSTDALEFDGYNTCVMVDYGDYIYPDDYANVTCNVQKEGDYYCITLITGTGSYGADGRTCRAVYIGKIK